MNPESAGRPNLKVIATDGVGDDAMVDVLSITLYVEEAEADSRVGMFIAASSGFVGILVVIAVIALRRQKKAELAMIDTWDSFGGFKPSSNDDKKRVELEGGAVEGSEEVLAEEEILDSDKPVPEDAAADTQPVAGIDLDWDDV
jgi:hypothetical protein